MPYKDPQRKLEWERRIARTGLLAAASSDASRRQAAQPARPEAGISGAAFILPMIAGGVLASHNPLVAMGAGGLTVFVAASYKKDWRWWLVGILLLALAVFFLLNKKDENK